MPNYRITFPDGTTNIIVADEEFCKTYTESGGSYELVEPPDPTDRELENRARMWRDKQLGATDFIVPLTDHPQRDAYLLYRQALRQWPETSEFPSGTKPTLGS